MQVAKWGNSLAIRLPAFVVEALQIKAGNDAEYYGFSLYDGMIVSAALKKIGD